MFEASTKNVSQQLWIGAGLKGPTGKFSIEANDPDVASVANTQLDSGSTDFLINAMYNIHINKFGISTTANYKINSSNEEEYKSGNKFSASSFIYYAFPVSNVIISPNLGLLFEYTEHSELNESKIELTGGKILQSSVGAEMGFKRTALVSMLKYQLRKILPRTRLRQKLKAWCM